MQSAIGATGGTTTGTVTLPAAPTAGNMLVLEMSAGSGAVFTTPTNWTILTNTVGSTNTASISFWKISDGTEQTQTVTQNYSNTGSLFYAEISGADTSTAPAASMTVQTGTTVAYTAETPTVANSLVLETGAPNGNAITLTTPTGYTWTSGSVQYHRMWGGYLANPATGTNAAVSSTASAADQVPALIVLIAPASVAAYHYRPPYTEWPNGAGLNQSVTTAKIIANQKSDASTVSFYANYKPTWTDGTGSIAGWDRPVWTTAGGSDNGLYLTAAGDPTYTIAGTCSNCGATKGLANIHIHNGSITENYYNSTCDCHGFWRQPLGWTGGGTLTLPDVSPGYYWVEAENVFNASGCSQGTQSCKIFSGGGNIYPDGADVISTLSTGYYGSTSGSGHPLYDGFSPGSSVPYTGWSGASVHGDIAEAAAEITAADVQSGVINHEIGLRVVCLENTAADAWPRSGNSTDGSCSSLGGTGWAYNEHVFSDQTPTQIMTDVANNVLKPLNSLVAFEMASYGAVTYDTLGSYGPTFAIPFDSGNPAWATIAASYGISSSVRNSRTGYLINMVLPKSYMSAHVHARNSCIVQLTC